MLTRKRLEFDGAETGTFLKIKNGYPAVHPRPVEPSLRRAGAIPDETMERGRGTGLFAPQVSPLTEYLGFDAKRWTHLRKMRRLQRSPERMDSVAIAVGADGVPRLRRETLDSPAVGTSASTRNADYPHRKCAGFKSEVLSPLSLWCCAGAVCSKNTKVDLEALPL